MATLTTVGLAKSAALLIAEFTDLVWGSGTAAESTSDTWVETEITTNGGEQATASTEVDGVTSRWTVTCTYTGTLAINEIAVANSSDEIYLRHVLPSTVNVVNGDEIEWIVESVMAQATP